MQRSHGNLDYFALVEALHQLRLLHVGIAVRPKSVVVSFAPTGGEGRGGGGREEGRGERRGERGEGRGERGEGRGERGEGREERGRE